MKVTIPNSVKEQDFDRFIEGRPQKIRALKDAIYYLVSRLTPPIYREEDHAHLRGYKTLKSEDLNRMTRNRFQEVKRILMSPEVTQNGPILLCDEIFVSGIKPLGFKLNHWVLNDKRFCEVELDKKYTIRYETIQRERNQKQTKFEFDFNHIYQALVQSQITINGDDARSYLGELENRLLTLVSDKDSQKVKEYIHDLNTVVDSIENGNFKYSVSQSNHRVNTVFTSMKRELRYFLRLNGEHLVEVDLTTYHAYTLATILTEDFFNKDDPGYNLHSLFPQLHKSFTYSCESMEYQDYVKKFVRNMIVESNVINDKYIEYYTYKGDVLSNINYPILDTFVSYMYGRFWRRAGIQKYRSLNFQNDVYELIGKDLGMSRAEVKDQFKLYINFSDRSKRMNVNLIKFLEKEFKEVSRFIQFLSSVSFLKNPFSYLIQRCESYLFLRVGCNKLSGQGISYITIHDAVLCSEDKKHEVKYLLTDSISIKTGLTPGIKFKELNDPFETLDQTAADIVDSFKKKRCEIKNREQGDSTEQNLF